MSCLGRKGEAGRSAEGKKSNILSKTGPEFQKAERVASSFLAVGSLLRGNLWKFCERLRKSRPIISGPEANSENGDRIKQIRLWGDLDNSKPDFSGKIEWEKGIREIYLSRKSPLASKLRWV